MSVSSIRLEAQAYQNRKQALLIPLANALAVDVTKRAMDIVIASLALLFGAPVFALIAVAIRLDTAGPVLYRQRRAGMFREFDPNGRARFSAFSMLKFRTMRVDAERFTGAVLAEENDPRVTRVGRFLRKTRLDELPQFWNVLCGDMSIVGPRPERPELLENLTLAIPFFEERMRRTKPGITGLAQVSLTYSGRAPTGSAVAALGGSLVNPFAMADAEGALADDMRTKLLFDVAYVAALERFWTFLLMDMSILIRTPWIMLRGVGR